MSPPLLLVAFNFFLIYFSFISPSTTHSNYFSPPFFALLLAITVSCLSSFSGKRLSLILCEIARRVHTPSLKVEEVLFFDSFFSPEKTERQSCHAKMQVIHSFATDFAGSLLQRAHSVAFDVKLTFFDCLVGEGIEAESSTKSSSRCTQPNQMFDVRCNSNTIADTFALLTSSIEKLS